MNEIIKLSVLTFLAGVFCKIYDDLNDNNLFHSFHLEKNKEYINEFLKTIHTILITYVSSFHIYTLLIILTLNIFMSIFDSNSFESPYEYSGIIAFSLFFFYLMMNLSKLNFNYFLPLIIVLFGTYFSEILLFKYVEFGYNKLVFRGVCMLLIILVLVINYCFKLCTDESLFFSWYFIGYYLTSCMFQAYLINQDTKQKTIKLRKCKSRLKINMQKIFKHHLQHKHNTIYSVIQFKPRQE